MFSKNLIVYGSILTKFSRNKHNNEIYVNTKVEDVASKKASFFIFRKNAEKYSKSEIFWICEYSTWNHKPNMVSLAFIMLRDKIKDKRLNPSKFPDVSYL